MSETHNISVDLMDSQIYDYIIVPQYNNSDVVNITITKYGEPYTVNEMNAVFSMRKLDGHIIINGCTVVNNVVTITLTYQMTVVSGKIPFQVLLYSGTEVLSSFNGTLIVTPAVPETDTEESTDEMTILQQISYYATMAKSYTVGGTGKRTGEDSDNTKYYYEMSRDSVTGLTPQGTVTFAQLTAISSPAVNDMYNISDAFTSTSAFKDGGDHYYPAGSNVYYTSDGKWDVLCGYVVTGVKGEAETNYRFGNVNLTKGNVGLPQGRNIIHSSTMPTTPPDIWLQPYAVE